MPRGALKETENPVWNAYVQLTSRQLQDCLPRGETNPLRREILKRLKAYGLDLSDRQLHQRLYRGGFSFAFGLALVEVLTRMKAAGHAVQVPNLSVGLGQALALAAEMPEGVLRKSRTRFPERPTTVVPPGGIPDLVMPSADSTYPLVSPSDAVDTAPMGRPGLAEKQLVDEQAATNESSKGTVGESSPILISDESQQL